MLLDFFCIFSTGGLILWYKQFINCKIESLINYLIKTVLLDQKRNLDSLTFSGSVLRWKISDDKGLIFVAAYQESYPILYVDKLISMIMTDFIKREFDSLSFREGLILDTCDFTSRFMSILGNWESDCSKILEGGENTKKAKELFNKKKSTKKDDEKKRSSSTKVEDNEDTEPRNKSIEPTYNNNTVSLNSNIPKNVQLRKAKSSKETKVDSAPSKSTKAPAKQKTVKDNFGEYDERQAKALDM
jgi:hypothetical protein